MLHRSMKASAVALMFLLAGCGSALTECVFVWRQTERLTYDGTRLTLALAGTGTTAALYAATDRTMPIAPDLRAAETFSDSGGPYIRQAYTGLPPGRYRLHIQGAADSTVREFDLRAGTSRTLYTECP